MNPAPTPSDERVVPSKSDWPRWLSFAWTRYIVAAVLLLAALLKGYAISTGPVAGTTVLDTWAFQVASVEAELLFAWLLIAGHNILGPMRRMCIALFTFFAVIAGYKAWLGESTCGCFGRVSVDPHWTVLLDLGLIALVFFSRVDDSQSDMGKSVKDPRHYGKVALGVYLLMAAPLTYGMLTYVPGALVAGGIGGRSQWVIDAQVGDFVLLEPEQWVGGTFPLYNQLNNAKALEAGEWTIVLFRYDCPHCVEHVPKLIRESQAAQRQIALVEVPPYAPASRVWWPTSGPGIWSGRLSEQYDWFV